MSFVLDCSVALAWIMPDEDDPRADAVLDRLRDEVAVVPTLWPLEVGNVLLMGIRRSRITESEAAQAIHDLRALPIEIDRKTHEHTFDKTSELALQHRLTLYDAAYLELAVRRKLQLSTLDEALGAACRAVGIELI